MTDRGQESAGGEDRQVHSLQSNTAKKHHDTVVSHLADHDGDIGMQDTEEIELIPRDKQRTPDVRILHTPSTLRAAVLVNIALIRLRTRLSQHDFRDLHGHLQKFDSCSSPRQYQYNYPSSVRSVDTKFTATSVTDNSTWLSNGTASESDLSHDRVPNRFLTGSPAISDRSGTTPLHLAVSLTTARLSERILRDVGTWVNESALTQRQSGCAQSSPSFNDLWPGVRREIADITAEIEMTRDEVHVDDTSAQHEQSREVSSTIEVSVSPCQNNNAQPPLLTLSRGAKDQLSPMTMESDAFTDLSSNSNTPAACDTDDFDLPAGEGSSRITDLGQSQHVGSMLPKSSGTAHHNGSSHDAQPTTTTTTTASASQKLRECFRCAVRGCHGTDHDICDFVRSIWERHDTFICIRCCDIPNVPETNLSTKRDRFNHARSNHGCRPRCIRPECTPEDMAIPGTIVAHDTTSQCTVTWQALDKELRYRFIHQLLQEKQIPTQPIQEPLLRIMQKLLHDQARSIPRTTRRRRNPVNTSHNQRLQQENEALRNEVKTCKLDVQRLFQEIAQQAEDYKLREQHLHESFEKALLQVEQRYRDDLRRREQVIMQVFHPQSAAPPVQSLPSSALNGLDRTDLLIQLPASVPMQTELATRLDGPLTRVLDPGTLMVPVLTGYGQRQLEGPVTASSAASQQQYFPGAESTAMGPQRSEHTDNTDLDMLVDPSNDYQSIQNLLPVVNHKYASTAQNLWFDDLQSHLQPTLNCSNYPPEQLAAANMLYNTSAEGDKSWSTFGNQQGGPVMPEDEDGRGERW